MICTNVRWALLVATLLGPTVAHAQRVDADQELTAPVGARPKFGSCVATDGTQVLVGGAAFEQPGSAYVYTRNAAGTWIAGNKLSAPPADEVPMPLPHDSFASGFGTAGCAIEGDWVLVAAEWAQGDRGAVYVFHKDSGGTWTQTQRVQETEVSTSGGGGVFGACVKMHGTTAIISAPYFNGWDAVAGRVFAFERNASDVYVEVGNFGPPTSVSNQLFGFGMDFDGTTIASTDRMAEQISLWTYAYSGTSATFTYTDAYSRTEATGAAVGDAWGDGVALVPGGLLAGARREDSPVSDVGAAYLFSRPGAHAVAMSVPGVPSGLGSVGYGSAASGDGRWVATIGLDQVDAFHQLADGSWTVVHAVRPTTLTGGDMPFLTGTQGVGVAGHVLVVGSPEASGGGRASIFHLLDADGVACTDANDCAGGFCACGVCSTMAACADGGAPDAGDVDLGTPPVDGGGTDMGTPPVDGGGGTDMGTSVDGGASGGGATLGDGSSTPRPSLSCFCSTPGGSGDGGGRGTLAGLLATLAVVALVVTRRRAALVVRRRVAPTVALLGALLLATTAHAQHHAADAGVAPPPEDPRVTEAREHFRLGSDHYAHGRFADAATEYQAAYDLSARPALLHNIYLARRDMGDVRGAVEALRRYLVEADDLSREDRNMLGGRLRAMEATLQHDQHDATPPEHHDVTPPPEHHDVTPPPEHHDMTPPPDHHDDVTPPATHTDDVTDLAPIGWGLVVGSVVPAVVAIVAGGAMLGERDGLYGMCNAPPGDACPIGVDVSGYTSRFELDRALMWTGIGVGIAALATGIVLVAMGKPSHLEHPPTPTATPSLACDAHGCQLALAGRF